MANKLMALAVAFSGDAPTRTATETIEGYETLDIEVAGDSNADRGQSRFSTGGTLQSKSWNVATCKPDAASPSVSWLKRRSTAMLPRQVHLIDKNCKHFTGKVYRFVTGSNPKIE